MQEEAISQKGKRLLSTEGAALIFAAIIFDALNILWMVVAHIPVVGTVLAIILNIGTTMFAVFFFWLYDYIRKTNIGALRKIIKSAEEKVAKTTKKLKGATKITSGVKAAKWVKYLKWLRFIGNLIPNWLPLWTICVVVELYFSE